MRYLGLEVMLKLLVFVLELHILKLKDLDFSLMLVYFLVGLCLVKLKLLL